MMDKATEKALDLGTLVALAEAAFSGAAGRGKLPKKHILTAQDGSDYKVRLYPDARQAQERARLLQEISDHILMTPILGYHGRGLIFAYPAVETIDPLDLSSYTAIGGFLAKLNGLGLGRNPDHQADQQFDLWVRGIARAGFISEHLAPAIQTTYQRLKPRGLRACIDYLDPMPHNFCRWNGKFCVLDEKHFHVAYPGVGLVKPRLVMTPAHWSAVQQGYQQKATASSDESQAAFCEIYYLVSALHFYSQLMVDGMVDVPANPRLRRYRQLLMERVLDSSRARNIERIRFWIRYPGAAYQVARSRGLGKVRRFLGLGGEGKMNSV